MKKVLPFNTSKPSKGFTLVELLVVIAIIAILAVIGFSVFAGAQGAARDGVRRSEISSLAKSIEASRDFQTNLYGYTKANFDADFPKGVNEVNRKYCIRFNTTNMTVPPDATANTMDTAFCPNTGAGCGGITDACGTTWTAVNNAGFTMTSAKTWTVCGTMERGTVFCQNSLIR